MIWALIATVEQPLIVWVPPQGTPPVGIDGYWSTITAQPGTVINLIVYDGKSEYTPPEGTALQQVADTAKIGDTGYSMQIN